MSAGKGHYGEGLRPLEVGTAVLTRFRGKPLPEAVPLYSYRTRANRLDAAAERRRLGRICHALSEANDSTPVVAGRDGRTLLAPAPLKTLACGDASVRIEEEGKVSYKTFTGTTRRLLEKIGTGLVKQQAARHGFVVGLENFVLSPKYRLEDRATKTALQTGVEFAIHIRADGGCHMDCDMRSRILLLVPLSRLIRDQGVDPRGMEVTMRSSNFTMIVKEVVPAKASDPDERLGVSIMEYGLARGYYEGLEPDPEAPLVKCAVGERGRIYTYDSALLYRVLDLEDLQALSPAVCSTFRDAARMTIEERLSFCRYFVSKVGVTSQPWLCFNPEPVTCGRGNDFTTVSCAVPRDNLIFHGGARAPDAREGMRTAGPLSPPPRITLRMLVPEGRKERAEATRRRLLEGLSSLPNVSTAWEVLDTREYPTANPFRLRELMEELSRLPEADILLVFLPPRHEETPVSYRILKAEAARTRLPSQMISIDAPLEEERILHIYLGITAKSGKGESWRIDRLLWHPELFVGISCEMDEGSHSWTAAASAFDGQGRPLDVTIENYKSADGARTIPESRLIHLLEGALLAYRHRYYDLPRTIVLHRDGPLYEANLRGAWKHFSSLGISINAVEIEPQSPPRMAIRTKDGALRDPEPGTAVLFSSEEAVLCTTSTERIGRGSPLPLLVRKQAGMMELEAILQQIFWLTRMHWGSLHPLRLPVTVHFARKAVAMALRGTIPTGTLGARMLMV